MITCPHCGGTFADEAVKCPYCGNMHLAGANAAYHQKAQDLADDLADLADDAAETYQETLHHHGKQVAKVVAIVAAVLILLLAIAALWRSRTPTTTNTEALKTQLLLQQEVHAALDEIYAQGDYDALLDYQMAVYDEYDDFTLMYWDHYEFLTTYFDYTIFLAEQAEVAAGGQTTTTDLAWFLCIVVRDYDSDVYETTPEEDVVLIQGYQQEMLAFLQEMLGVSEAEIDAFYQAELAAEGWCSYTSCEEFIERWYQP